MSSRAVPPISTDPSTLASSSSRMDNTPNGPSSSPSSSKAKASSSPFSASIPLPSLPSSLPFPTIPGLRTALLGYLGEAETAIREKLGREAAAGDRWVDSPATATASGFGADGIRYRGLKNQQPPSLESISSSSASSQQTSDDSDPQANGVSHRPAHPQRTVSNQDALLSALSALREDIGAYLPSAAAMLSAPASSREWLRTVPQRLMAVERSLRPAATVDNDTGYYTGTFGRYGKGKAADEAGTMEAARKRVLEMVRGVLPDDEWEGWERLGWEETDLNGHHDLHPPKTTRSRGHTFSAFPSRRLPTLSSSLDIGGSAVYDDDDDVDEVDDTEVDGLARRKKRALGDEAEDEEEEADEEEEEQEEEAEEQADRYLFPNRTPAAAQAIAEGRRRVVRSKSLGSAAYPSALREVLGLSPIDRTSDSGFGRSISAAAGMPALQRMKTLPNYSSPLGQAGDLDDTRPELSEEELDTTDGINDIEQLATYDGGALRLDSVPRKPGPNLRLPDFASLAPASLGPFSAVTKDTTAAGVTPITPMTPLTAKLFGAEGLGPTVAEALRLSADGKRLVRFDDLPFHWRNNEHIHTGYRYIPLHASTGPIPLIKSAFAWHNETINIHSHFIPTICILLFIPLMSYASPLPDAHPLDTAMLALYLLAAVACMSCSAGWHVLSGCASRKWFEWGACVDYIGISWLIAASFGTVVYNAFYCKPNAVFLYLGTNAACGALGSYLPFQRWFNLRRMKPYRIAFFLLLNFAMFAPMLQMFWKYGSTRGSAFVAPFVPSVIAYVSGLLCYGFHFPECIMPGKFDYIMASHQLWHTGIVTAIILHYRAVFFAHSMRYEYSCAVPDAGLPVSLVVEGWLRSVIGR